MGIRSKMSGNSATPNAALARLQASVRIGGKGTVRRKKKVVHKTTTTDDKRLQNTLKRLGINSIPAIEEVNLFMDQGEVIHFTNPKVQASIAANTYVIIGHAETSGQVSAAISQEDCGRVPTERWRGRRRLR